jgi:hypothetical protein
MGEKEGGCESEVLGDVNILTFKHVPRHPLGRARDIYQGIPGIV